MTITEKAIKKLEHAIKNRYSISFEYNKIDKPKGVRLGDPYAIYIKRNKDNSISTKVDIVQTGGVTDSEIQKFKIFNIEDLANVTITNDTTQFVIHEYYRPESPRYDNVIVKV